MAPILVPAAAAAALGFNLLPLVPARSRSNLLIPFLVLFLVMTILDQEPGWNIALLVGFSISGGMLLHWSAAEAARWSTWLTFLGLTGFSIIGSGILGKTLQKGLKFLLPLTAIYMLAWVGILIWELPPWIMGTLIYSGLILFTVISAGTFQRGFSLKNEDSAVPLSIEWWVILFNLFWLTGLIPFRN